MANWSPTDPTPEGLSSTTIRQSIEIIDAKLAPARPRQILAGVLKLLRHATAFNIQVDAKALEAVYLSECRTFPAALFDDAISAILHRWNNEFRLPTPAAIWEMVDTEHERLVKERAILQKAAKAAYEQSLNRVRIEQKPITSEETQELLGKVGDVGLRKALAKLGETITKRDQEGS